MIAASSNGEGKNALAACDSWWSANVISPRNPAPRFWVISSAMSSRSDDQRDIARPNDAKPDGANVAAFSRMRSNFTIGFS